MEYKECIECKLNYTNNFDGVCDCCKNKKSIQSGATQIHKGRVINPINDYFTFKNQVARYSSLYGYEAYNSKNENIGFVFMTRDKRTDAYGHCEIHFYPYYQTRYQEWRRITSHGQRIAWDDLCYKIEKYGECKYYID